MAKQLEMKMESLSLKQEYSVETGTVLTINTKTKKKLYSGEKELKDISTALTPQKSGVH